MKYFTTTLALLLSLHFYGQKVDGNFPPPTEAPIIEAVKASTKITIDGDQATRQTWSDTK